MAMIWKKKKFLNFVNFHGRQPFRPILRPGQKVHRQVNFFQFFLFWQLVLYVGKYIDEIQDVIFPYFFKIQFFPFLTFLASLRNNL